MLPGTEGGLTLYKGERCRSDAAMKYIADRTPTGSRRQECGTGLARLGGQGTQLLGVKAIITPGFERIHRSNLVGMGVLPLRFLGGDGAQSLGIQNGRDLDLGQDISIRLGTDCPDFMQMEAERNQGEKPDRHPDRGRR